MRKKSLFIVKEVVNLSCSLSNNIYKHYNKEFSDLDSRVFVDFFFSRGELLKEEE